MTSSSHRYSPGDRVRTPLATATVVGNRFSRLLGPLVLIVFDDEDTVQGWPADQVEPLEAA